MLYPIGVQIPFAAGFTASKVGATGLTVYVSIVRQASDGSRTVVIALASNTAATEVDATNQPGVYSYLLAGASTGTAGYYFATFHTAGTADTKDITALEIVGAAWVQAAATDLDATISSRNATAPDNTSIATILTRTDVATSTRASATDYTTARAAKLDNLDVAVSTRNATAPDNASIATILTRTDVATSTRSSHSAADVWAVGTRTLTGFGTLVADMATAVWAALSRTLTQPVGDATAANQVTINNNVLAVPGAVWTVGTRTLTSLGTLAADTATAVWAAATRTLTAFGFPVTLAQASPVIILSPQPAADLLVLDQGVDYTGSAAILLRRTGGDALPAGTTGTLTIRQPHGPAGLGTVAVVDGVSDPRVLSLTVTADDLAATTAGRWAGALLVSIGGDPATIREFWRGTVTIRVTPGEG